MNEKKIIVVLGPTASGKTKFAIELAKKNNTSIVNADSRQVYKELKIGTAAPTLDEQAGIKHYCLGHVSIHDDYNAGLFEKDALAALEEIFKTTDIAIVCGGTGLYINALLYGFDELPETDKKLRSEIITLYETQGIFALQEKLKKLDSDYFEKIDQKNPQRLMRAIEICLQSGKKHSELITKSKKIRDFEVEKIGLELDREELYKRINLRVDDMMQKGLLKEVQALNDYKNLLALKTVGYTELFDYIEGKWDLDTAIEKIKQHTRNYAKRQLTWFKKDQEINWLKNN